MKIKGDKMSLGFYVLEAFSKGVASTLKVPSRKILRSTLNLSTFVNSRTNTKNHRWGRLEGIIFAWLKGTAQLSIKACPNT